jgi:hypothetical protein
LRSGGWNEKTYLLATLIDVVEFEELLFFFVVVVGADEHHNEHGQENCEALNPSYIQIL